MLYRYPNGYIVPPFQRFNRKSFPFSSAAVTYTQAIVPTSGTPPTTATLTYTLSATLGSNIIFTPTSLTASFSPATVTINAMSLTGSTTVTLDYVGTTTIASTNNGGLSNPAPVTWFGNGGGGGGGGGGAGSNVVNITRPFTQNW